MTAATVADAIVVGAGPAGRAVAARLAHHGADVRLVDPAPDRGWRATYACWADELPGWIPDDVVASRATSIRVYSPHPIDVDRAYVVLDTAALHRFLSEPDGVRVRTVRDRATSVTAHTARLTDGSRLDADIVIDARGGFAGGIRQTAYGIVVDTDRAAEILGDAGAVLMDWRRPTGVSWSRTPSFLYAVPLTADRFLVEETCLVGNPALSIAELRGRLTDRLGGLPAMYADERVSFGVTGARTPWRSPTLLYGARAGLMHPATGYSVAASLGAADTIADAVVGGHTGDPVRTLWPQSARQVYRLRLIGLNLLLALDHSETCTFFDAFFRLPPSRQRDYLSSRTNTTGTARTMAALLRAVPNRLRTTMIRAAATDLLGGGVRLPPS
ncbi:lycopene cyclase family protein [Gordonia sinesedis]